MTWIVRTNDDRFLTILEGNGKLLCLGLGDRDDEDVMVFGSLAQAEAVAEHHSALGACVEEYSG